MIKKGNFMCCLVMCISLLLTACRESGAGDGSNISDADRTLGESAVSDIAGEKEWVYVPEMITVGDKKADYEDMQLVGDHICYVSMNGETQDEVQRICKYSLIDKELSDTPIDWPMEEKNRDVVTYVFDQDCSVWLIANVYSADFSQLSRFLCRFDAEGKNLISQDITEQLGRESDISALSMDGQGHIYVFAGDAGILLYDSDGSFHGSIQYHLPENILPQKDERIWGRVRIRGTFTGDDERFYVCMEKDASDHCILYEVDFGEKQMTEVIEDFPDINGICVGRRPDGSGGEADRETGRTDGSNDRGSGSAGTADDPARQYDLLLYDDTGVYGYDLSVRKSGSEQLMEELFVWSDSDINGYFVTNMGVLGDGRYVCMVVDWGHDDVGLALLTGTRAEDVPQREELILAAVGDGSELTALAVNFNRGSDRHHITVKNYDSLTELYNAILAGENMDIIDLSGVDVEKLSAQGVLEDLTPWLEQSDALAPSDFVDGILDVYTFDGILAGIPAVFRIRTVVGNGSQAENGTELTLEELLAAADRRPEAMAFYGVTREEMMQYLMMFNGDTFIDRDTGACHFDSESFKAVLEYVKRFPDLLEIGGEDTSLPTRIRKGEVLFAIAELNVYDSFQEFVWMFGEDAACVGFPTPDGRGGHILFADDAYGIAAVSEHKEGAWRFIGEFLAQEKSAFYYASRSTYFSTLKKVLNEKVENSMEAGRQIPADQFPRHIYDDGAVFQFHVLTWDEVNVILDLVPDAKPWFYMEEDEIFRIISEEAQAYYCGQKGIEDVVRVIQNRAQLYVDENM